MTSDIIRRRLRERCVHARVCVVRRELSASDRCVKRDVIFGANGPFYVRMWVSSSDSDVSFTRSRSRARSPSPISSWLLDHTSSFLLLMGCTAAIVDSFSDVDHNQQSCSSAAKMSQGTSSCLQVGMELACIRRSVVHSWCSVWAGYVQR